MCETTQQYHIHMFVVATTDKYFSWMITNRYGYHPVIL